MKALGVTRMGRVTTLLAGAAAIAFGAAPATAQIADDVALNIMRECAKIDDPTARLACYDNNMTRAGATARATVPGQTVRGVTGGGAPIDTQTQGPQGFGFEDVRAIDPARFQPRPGELEEIHPRIASVTPREPGVYLFTLEDGSQWLIAESVGREYRVPRRGEQIEIERGALGSFLMRSEGQAPVAVRRTR